MSRACGTCAACCTAMAVDDLDGATKPAGERCAHVARDPGRPSLPVLGGSCGTYETRPDGCRAFRCLWLLGNFGGQERPDRAGVVLWTSAELKPDRVVVATEARAGALDEIANRGRLRDLERAGYTIQPFRFGVGEPEPVVSLAPLSRPLIP